MDLTEVSMGMSRFRRAGTDRSWRSADPGAVIGLNLRDGWRADPQRDARLPIELILSRK